MKVYVAAASGEIDRAEHWIAKLREAGIMVTCTWPESVRRVGHANPPEAPHSQRRGWAVQDLTEVDEGNALWVLLPSLGFSTSGAWTELGFAYARAKLILMSGKSHSVFTGLADEVHETDRQAFGALVRLAQLRP